MPVYSSALLFKLKLNGAAYYYNSSRLAKPQLESAFKITQSRLKR
jgi:hypothetical protein